MQWSTCFIYYLIIHASSLLREVKETLIFIVFKVNDRSVAEGLVGVSEQKKRDMSILVLVPTDCHYELGSIFQCLGNYPGEENEAEIPYI